MPIKGVAFLSNTIDLSLQRVVRSVTSSCVHCGAWSLGSFQRDERSDAKPLPSVVVQGSRGHPQSRAVSFDSVVAPECKTTARCASAQMQAQMQAGGGYPQSLQFAAPLVQRAGAGQQRRGWSIDVASRRRDPSQRWQMARPVG